MRIFNIKIRKPQISVCAAFLFISVLITSCEKEDNGKTEAMVPGVTSIRLVHSSEISSMSLLDLYVDGTKINIQGITYPLASAYFSTGAGTTKKIEVKKGTAVVADTTLNIREGHQYSVFVKELQSGIFNSNNELLQAADIKKLIITEDNNTSIPASGTAKVRCVNAATTGNLIRANGGTKGATFIRINGPGPYPDVEYLTFNLADIGSDFVTLRPGNVSFRGSVLPYTLVTGSPVLINVAGTLDADKLYTLYITGSPGGNLGGTIVPSTLGLKLIENNP